MTVMKKETAVSLSSDIHQKESLISPIQQRTYGEQRQYRKEKLYIMEMEMKEVLIVDEELHTRLRKGQWKKM